MVKIIENKSDVKVDGIMFECNTCGFEHSIQFAKELDFPFLSFDSINKDKGIDKDVFFGKEFYMQCQGCKGEDFSIMYFRNYK